MIPFKQLFSYGSAVLNHLLAGGKVVSETIYEARATICRRCPSNKENVCQECGCNLEGDSAFVSKLLMPAEHCPLNKWCSYDQIGQPIPKRDPKLYEINMMLRVDGSHIYQNIPTLGGKLSLVDDPLDNSKFGEIVVKSDGGQVSSQSLPYSVETKAGDCGCAG